MTSRKVGKAAREKSTERPYNVLAIGDSVMWGQGHLAKDTFAEKVAKYIQEDAGKRSVQVANLAHSGAVIGTTRAESASAQPYLYGELPRTYPDLYTQLRASKFQYRSSDTLPKTYLTAQSFDSTRQSTHKKRMKKTLDAMNSGDPDLILPDGGINDLGATQILNPLDQDKNEIDLPDSLRDVRRFVADWRHEPKQFEREIKQFCYERMRRLLVAVHRAHPTSKMVVTGYYPIFTKGSALGAVGGGGTLAAMLLVLMRRPRPLRVATLTALTAAYALLSKLVIERNDYWYKRSRHWLDEAVDNANESIGSRACFFAQPRFGKDNGGFAKKSYLYEFTLSSKFPKKKSDLEKWVKVSDPQKRYRKTAWDKFYNSRSHDGDKSDGSKFSDYRASIAHPNDAGVQEYTRAIMSVIRGNSRAFGLRLVMFQSFCKKVLK